MIGVTGATGNVGKEVVKLLGNRAKPLSRPLFDYNRPETYAAALSGIDRLLLVAEGGSPAIAAFLKQASHLKHVVVISGMSAMHRHSDLLLLEECVLKANLPYTFLRCNWFMQNFTTFYKEDVKKGLLSFPCDGPVSFIDVRDIAEVVVACFEKGLVNQTFILTGPETLTFLQAARRFNPETQLKKVRFEGEMARLFEDIENGLVAPVYPDVERLLGKPARSFTDFLCVQSL
jgi:uncharacterized protein YbjT (DUF2867 family)